MSPSWNRNKTTTDNISVSQSGGMWCSSARRRSVSSWARSIRPSALLTRTSWSRPAGTQRSWGPTTAPRSSRTSASITCSCGRTIIRSARRSWGPGRTASAEWTSVTRGPGSSPGTATIYCSWSETCRWPRLHSPSTFSFICSKYDLIIPIL